MTLQHEERYLHNRSRYERPNLNYRCGRGSMWGRPCDLGPAQDGGCGGVYECRPLKRGGIWVCSRPDADGGSCEAGPDTAGKCSRNLPPCVPRRTLRSYRGIFAFAALVVVVALIAAFHDDNMLVGTRFAALDAGPLTAIHASFTREEGCGACHEVHGAGPLQWLSGVIQKGNMTGECVDCHVFTDPIDEPHNLVASKLGIVAGTSHESRWSSDTLACNSCHTEHRGAEANISRLSDAQCSHCHTVQFAAFDDGHPSFSPTYPHFQRTAIKFDHITHINTHFASARVADQAPQFCVDCHDVATSGRDVPPKGFDETCAGCHSADVVDREMLLLTSPYFDEEPLNPKELPDICGEPPDELDEEYSSEGDDDLSPISAYLLSVSADDPDDYGSPMGELILAMAEDGTAPLADLLFERTESQLATTMLQGLSAELVQRLACTWGSNFEYEAPSEGPPASGWYGDFFELKYRPSGHSDPVVRSWLEFALAAVDQSEDDLDVELAESLWDDLINPGTGVGACIKCHAVSKVSSIVTADGRENFTFDWSYKTNTERPLDVYAHDVHLNLVGPGGVGLQESAGGCVTCHKLNSEADFPASFEDFDTATFSSNFSPVTKEDCVQCHAVDRIRQDCQLCHVYHPELSFSTKVVVNKKFSPKPHGYTGNWTKQFATWQVH